jgi:hypothetical protein
MARPDGDPRLSHGRRPSVHLSLRLGVREQGSALLACGGFPSVAPTAKASSRSFPNEKHLPVMTSHFSILPSRSWTIRRAGPHVHVAYSGVEKRPWLSSSTRDASSADLPHATVNAGIKETAGDIVASQAEDHR